jgi:heme/copper-type cytochrome/quinol oxidase subunit 2
MLSNNGIDNIINWYLIIIIGISVLIIVVGVIILLVIRKRKK